MTEKDISDSGNMEDLLDLEAIHEVDTTFEDKNNESLLADDSDGKANEVDMVFWKPGDDDDDLGDINNDDDDLGDTINGSDDDLIKGDGDDKVTKDNNNCDEVKSEVLCESHNEGSKKNANDSINKHINIEHEAHLEIEIQVGKEDEMLHDGEEEEDDGVEGGEEEGSVMVDGGKNDGVVCKDGRGVSKDEGGVRKDEGGVSNDGRGNNVNLFEENNKNNDADNKNNKDTRQATVTATDVTSNTISTVISDSIITNVSNSSNIDSSNIDSNNIDSSNIDSSNIDISNNSSNNSSNNKRKHSISPILWSGNAEANEGDANDFEPEASSKKSRLGLSKDRESRLKYIFRSARFFLIKSNNHDNVELAKQKDVWSTPPQNEARLNQAFKLCANVILIFSVTESGKFQGFARLASESDKNHPPIKWVLPPGLEHRSFTSVFKLDWISKNSVEFHDTMHLKNPWNMYRPVKIGRDGQELEPTVGEVVCRMFPEDPCTQLHRIASLAKHSLRKAHIQASVTATGGSGGAGGHDNENGVVGSGGNGGRENGVGGQGGLSSVVRLPGGGRGGGFEGGASSSLSSSSHMNFVEKGPRSNAQGYRRHNEHPFDGHYRDTNEHKADGIPVRYGVRREVLLNGSYSDYVREFTNTPSSSHPPIPLAPNPAYPYLQSPPPVYMYDQNALYTGQSQSSAHTMPYTNQPINPYSYSNAAYLSNQAPSNHSNPGGYIDHRTSASYRNHYDHKYSRNHHR